MARPYTPPVRRPDQPLPGGREHISDPRVDGGSEGVAAIAAVAGAAGLRRVHMLAWRDYDDPEAGGSEVHAERIAARWAAAGVDVTMRTSHAAGHPTEISRHGYRVVRRAGRYMVFPRAAIAEATDALGPRDGLVEIWNGMPFFSPLWCRGPRMVFLHHFHAEMWDMTLPPTLAKLGRTIEERIAPPLYRKTEIVTLSESSRRELVEEMGLPTRRVNVVAPGIEERFSPGGSRSSKPMVLAVGRLVPVKQFDRLLRAVARLRSRHPDVEVVIAGEGYEREALEALRGDLDGTQWCHLPGRVSDEELVELYRRAWVVTATSLREGWNMSLTEAAACGAPAIASRIAGHEDSVIDGETGLLFDDDEGLVDALDRVIGDARLRHRMSAAALRHASQFTWDATALHAMEILARDARRRTRRGAG